ncbi:hypothetical protein BZG02_05010 [Labilibaculum filiforme]|uniref:Uncharacterized protein n=1 Tax=Labilibaculum filiforme TaxID=1940526 RepID=A0A2N3I1Q3_9BACT|nr:hypothetical protein BZG02_05010 [Labilibaculum filiforme]
MNFCFTLIHNKNQDACQLFLPVHLYDMNQGNRERGEGCAIFKVVHKWGILLHICLNTTIRKGWGIRFDPYYNC